MERNANGVAAIACGVILVAGAVPFHFAVLSICVRLRSGELSAGRLFGWVCTFRRARSPNTKGLLAFAAWRNLLAWGGRCQLDCMRVMRLVQSAFAIRGLTLFPPRYCWNAHVCKFG